MQNDRLWQLINEHSLITGKDMSLSAGAKSTYYFDCKKVTLHGEALQLIADAFLEKIDQLPETPKAISGLTLGADFIVAGVVLRAWQTSHTTCHGAIVRKEAKKHGTRTHIENDLPPGTLVAVVDDVITTGSSTAMACDQLLAAGCRIAGIIAIIDREVGGAQDLAKKYQCPVYSLFRTSDFPRTIG